MCELKYCPSCKENKNLRHFYNCKNSPDGKKYKCKTCLKNKILVQKVTKENVHYCNLCHTAQEVNCFNAQGIRLNACKLCIDSLASKSLKICTMCKIVKPFSDFSKAMGKILNLNPACKKCVSSGHKEYSVNCDYKMCYICKNTFSAEDFHKGKRVKDGLSSYCKTCTKEKHKKYDKNTELNSERTKERIKKDPKFKLSKNTRNIIYQSFKRACKGTYKKSDRTENILGCTIQEFIEHLQSLFTEGMTLENNGQCEECWHIDHKIPLATAETEEDIIKLCHYTNLQPLWRNANLSKGNKLI